MSENIYHTFSGMAGALDLVAHTFGKRDLATKTIVTAGAGEQPDGLIHDDYSAGRGATLETDGYPLRAKVGVGGVVAGNLGMVGAGGTLVAWTAGNLPVVYIHTTAAEGALAEVQLLARRNFVPQANIVPLVDNTGLSGTHDDTLAATAVPADIAGGESPTEAEFNALLAVVRVMAQNISDLAQKNIELTTLLDAHKLTL